MQSDFVGAATLFERGLALFRALGDNRGIALSLNKSMVEGFLEDKLIIEGQQQVLDADPNFKMNAIVADAPLAHFRRTLGRLIDAERQALQPAAA